MNDEALMNYEGEDTFDKIKRLNLKHTEPYKKYTDRWDDHYVGMPKTHPLKLQGIISEVLTENEQIKGIVEIGTYYGALSCYLGAECIERGYKPLLTFDNKVRYTPKLFKSLKVNFVVDDCFSKKSLKIIKDYVKDTPVLFICDGGFKAKEFNTFSPLLPAGSVVGVHDWEVEVNEEGIKETVDFLNMYAIKENQWNAAPDHTLMAFFGIPKDYNTPKKYGKEAKGNKKKIFIGIPTTGNVMTELTKWLLQIVKHPDYLFDIYLTGNSTICHNRNLICRAFLKGNADWMMCVDSDVVPPLDIMKILDNDKKIIAPINFVWKSWGLAPLISKDAPNGEKGYVITDPIAANSKEMLVEVDGTGTTCLFIHREVLEKMEAPHFMFDYDKEGKICLGEDYSFCKKAKKLGYKIWIDKRFMTHHFKTTSLKAVNKYLVKEVKLAEERLKGKFKEELGKYELKKK